MNGKKIVITGASGFLGRHLLKVLREEPGLQICALSSRPEELSEETGAQEIIFLHKDAVFGPEAEEILRGAVVIHCAYPRNSKGAEIADGLLYIRRVFEAAAEHHAAAVINISSQSVYPSDRAFPAKEDTPLSLENSYAVGKYAVELMLEGILSGTETAFTSLRMASLIGPGFDQRIVNRFVKQALESGAVTVRKNRQQFGFMDVLDAAEAIARIALSDPRKWERVYNIGPERSVTLTEIADTVASVTKESCGRNTTVTVTEGEESSSSAVDASLFKAAFGEGRNRTLKESVQRILDHERKRA